MSFWVAIVLIVLIGSLGNVLSERYKAMGREDKNLNKDERRVLEDERNRARDEIAVLRERVETLERIATDPSRRTAEEIEALRSRD